MKYIDTHIHATDLNAKDLKNLIENDKIEKFIYVSAKEADWEETARLCGLHPQKIIPAFGLHPWYAGDANPGWEKRLEEYLQKHPNALIGETGLDRLKNPEQHPQFEVFATQLNLAKKHNRPAIIHTVKANDWIEDFWDKLPAKFVFHSYSGKEEFLKKILSKGGYVSFSPSILKNKSRFELIKMMPKDKILIETDAPFQGGIEALFDIARTISEIRAEDMNNRLYRNAKEFLNV